TFEVNGSGIVTVVSTADLDYSNFEEINPGEKISIDGIRIGFLQEGSKFDLTNWKIIQNN
ncbi:MAG: hypothetical protein ABR597_05795, partial [Bacteroidales bacterium]